MSGPRSASRYVYFNVRKFFKKGQERSRKVIKGQKAKKAYNGSLVDLYNVNLRIFCQKGH